MKTLGLVTVFSVCFAVGIIKSGEYKKSENELKAFIELVYFIRREISGYLTPQHEIYRKFTNSILEANGFLGTLRKNSANGISSPLNYTLESKKETLRLGGEPFYVLASFSEGLGSFSELDECQRCERCAKELEAILKKQKEETEQKVRLCKSIGGLVGIGLVLLLW